ncbi:MAG: methyltransferase [Bacteroidetes bacterium]|nr:methyltransferase [Bacteroidota bacterium]
MANSYFQFKQFTIHQDRCAMKVTTDGCLFGAWVAEQVERMGLGACSLMDIGTGTGLLSLMLAQKNPAVKIDAIEIEGDAAAQASENIRAANQGECIQVLLGDAKDTPADKNIKYDVIISNPPFYENELASPDNKKNTAHHAGGLLLDELFSLVNTRLQADGYFFCLLPFKRMAALGPLFEKYKLQPVHYVWVRQTEKHPFFRVMMQVTHKREHTTTCTELELSITGENRNYTAPFIRLLHDYYLAL